MPGQVIVSITEIAGPAVRVCATSGADPPGRTDKDPSSPAGLPASRATARPSVTPRWNPASRSRTSAAERLGASAGCERGTAPGTRFAFGSRLGSPASVGDPAAGDSTVCAARQPSSAGEDHWPPALTAVPAEPGALAPLNQLDSTASKIGSLRSSAGFTAAGTITLLSADPVSCWTGAVGASRGEASCAAPLPPGADASVARCRS